MKFSKTQSYSLLAAMLAVASAHRARVEPFGPELAHAEFVTPASVGASFGHSFFTGAAHDPTKVATDFVERELSSSDYVVKNSYTSAHNGVTHVYLRQMVDGLEVVNGNININVDRSGNVISYGDSFYKGQRKVDLLSIKDWIKKETESFREGRQLSFGGWGRRTRQVMKWNKTNHNMLQTTPQPLQWTHTNSALSSGPLDHGPWTSVPLDPVSLHVLNGMFLTGSVLDLCT